MNHAKPSIIYDHLYFMFMDIIWHSNCALISKILRHSSYIIFMCVLSFFFMLHLRKLEWKCRIQFTMSTHLWDVLMKGVWMSPSMDFWVLWLEKLNQSSKMIVFRNTLMTIVEMSFKCCKHRRVVRWDLSFLHFLIFVKII